MVWITLALVAVAVSVTYVITRKHMTKVHLRLQLDKEAEEKQLIEATRDKILSLIEKRGVAVYSWHEYGRRLELRSPFKPLGLVVVQIRCGWVGTICHDSDNRWFYTTYLEGARNENIAEGIVTIMAGTAYDLSRKLASG